VVRFNSQRVQRKENGGAKEMDGLEYWKKVIEKKKKSGGLVGRYERGCTSKRNDVRQEGPTQLPRAVRKTIGRMRVDAPEAFRRC